jgi:hypothetical protein
VAAVIVIAIGIVRLGFRKTMCSVSMLSSMEAASGLVFCLVNVVGESFRKVSFYVLYDLD